MSNFEVTSEQYASEHMKFMGIAIDGDIDKFKSALLKKGYKLSDMNNIADPGQTFFEGIYENQKSNIIVAHDPDSKTVIGCSVVPDRVFSTKAEALNYLEKRKDAIVKEYGKAIVDLSGINTTTKVFVLGIRPSAYKEGTTGYLVGRVEFSISEEQIDAEGGKKTIFFPALTFSDIQNQNRYGM